MTAKKGVASVEWCKTKVNCNLQIAWQKGTANCMTFLNMHKDNTGLLE